MFNPFLKNKKKTKVERLGGFVKNTIGWNAIKSSADDIVKDLNVLKEQSMPKTGQNIDFETAVKKNGLDEAGLKKIYSNFKILFYSNLLLLLVYLCITAYMYKQHSLNIFYMMASIGFLLILFTNIFRSSYRCKQISGRNFISISEWLKNPSSWIPAKEIVSLSELKRKNKSSKVLKI